MSLQYTLNHGLWQLVDLIYPPVCAGCGKPNFRFCPDCLQQVSIIETSFCAFCGKPTHSDLAICPDCVDISCYFSAAASWAEYGGQLREVIHALKYKNDLGLGDFFAVLLIEILKNKVWDFDLVIPVPLSQSRMKERSYNQAALLSRPIAWYFRKEHSTHALRRSKDTGTQTSRNRIERDLSLTDAFSGNPAKLKGRSVLLVDDIITTGATINHCSQALLLAGATRVYAISIAKTMRISTSIDSL